MGFFDWIKAMFGGAGAPEATLFGGTEVTLRQTEIGDLAFRAGGAQLLSRSWDGTLQMLIGSPKPKGPTDDALVVWDVATGAVAARFDGPHTRLATSSDGEVFALTTIPSADGTAGACQVVAADGTVLHRVDDVLDAALSGDGATVITLHGDQTVRSTQVGASEAEWRVRCPEARVVTVDPRSGRVAVRSADDVELLDAAGTVVREWSPGSVRLVDFLPDGRLIVATELGTQLVDGETTVDLEHPGGYGTALAFAAGPDGGFATGHRDGAIRMWSAEGAAIANWSSGRMVGALVFAPDGSVLVSGARGDRGLDRGQVRFWEVASGEEVGRVGHRDEVEALGVTMDEVLSIGADRQVLRWSIEEGAARRVTRLQYTHRWYGIPADLAYFVHPEGGGRGLAVGSGRTGEVRLVAASATKGASSLEVAVSADGRHVLLAAPGRVSVVAIATDEEVFRHPTPGDRAAPACFLGDGVGIAEQAADGTFSLVIVGLDGAEGSRTALPGDLWVRRLLAHGSDVVLVRWHGTDPPGVVDVGTGRLTRWSVVADFPEDLWAMAPDGRTVANVQNGNQVALRDARTGAITTLLPAQADRLSVVAFGPDGSVWAGGYDGVLRRWVL